MYRKFNSIMSIPTFIIEEHHEAFIVWNYAIQKGLIPPSGNTLFHVDEHSDMRTPRFNSSIHNLNGSIDEINDFTYSELGIGNFIMPAIYKKIFNKVFWIKQKHRFEKVKRIKMYIRSYNQVGKKLISGKYDGYKKIKNDIDIYADVVSFDYFLTTINSIPSNRKIILDIDLDYFSCSGNPNELEEIYIEITKNEYDDFKSNKYHRLNFCGFERIEACKNGNKYFYCINNYNEIYPSNVHVDNDEIQKRITAFCKVIQERQVKPIIISICRSKHSGFTPKEQVDYIENELLNKLSCSLEFEEVSKYLV